MQPLTGARNVFTDASSTGRAVVSPPPYFEVQSVNTNSAQVAELVAVQISLQKYAYIPLILFTDSQYISQILALLETAACITSVSRVQMQLLAIQALLCA